MTIALRQRPLARVVAGIVRANNGAWFDPSDLSTLFQDAAGTTPVTAVEQPVGLMLDKSRGLMLGPELVSNGTFDNSTGWYFTGDTTGWSISGGVASCMSSAASNRWLNLSSGIEIGKTYLVYITASISAGVVATDSSGISILSNGLNVKRITATRNVFRIIGDAAFVGSIDNISVKELYGYHATQSITASRPTLSARKNILLATETLATQSVATLAATYTLSFTGTGSVTLSGTATGTLTGTGADRVSLTFTPTAGTLTLTVSGSVTKAQLGLGSVVTSYQRVTTATDYDVSAHYYYLRFDGVDDYLNLPYMGLYANGSASVVVGMARSKTGTVKYALTEGSYSGGKNYIPFRLSDYGVSSRIVNDSGTTLILTPDSAGAASSIPEVISFIDNGSSLVLAKNANITNSSAYTRYGTLTLNNLTIGAIVQSTTTENMLANLYGLIVTKSALTDSQRVACERYLGRKSGVQL